ncbi:hypothetical protein F5Y14DRAFT_454322 [Nemania sp. NC0429]|nr:hypothetical protein F5Y14DRAFT_454322 [Nemania sp. NC0429]
MENLARDIHRVLPTTDEEKRTQNGRPTPRSLPKLIIPPYRGAEPRKIPASQAILFLNAIAARSEMLGNRPPANDFKSPAFDGEHDPYLEDLPTPADIQFTKNEEKEIAEWERLAGAYREAHTIAFEKLKKHPKDRELMGKVRALSIERKRNLEAITQARDRRKIRKNFRRDFNNLLTGW